MKYKLLTLVFCIFLINSVSAASLWLDDLTDSPSSDATNFPGQNCFPEVICGDSGGTAICISNSSLSAPASTATSNTDYSSSFDGGYIINAYATADGTSPQCDNSGSFWCDRNSSCYTAQHRDTICTANVFAQSTCGSCRTNYLDCNSDGGDCEIQVGGTCGSGTGTYSSTCAGSVGNCTSSLSLDCNDDDSDSNAATCNGADGCEILIGGSCSVGTLSGTYSSTCTGSVGTCVVTKSNFETGSFIEYLTSVSESAMLWFKNFAPTGWLINVTNSQDETWGINNESCMVLKDGTEVCNAGDLGGDSSSWVSGSSSIYNVTANVGIGTASPNSSLHVNGTITLSNGSDSNSGKMFVDSSGDMIFRI